MSLEQKIINGIIEREGGSKFTNDRADSGGPTRWGVTERVARQYGYKGRMEDLPYEIAYAIYKQMYWDALRLGDIEKLSLKIAEELADTAVNCGPTTASMMLQRALNALNDRGRYFPDIKVDGRIGPATVGNLAAYLKARKKDGELVMFRVLNCLQGARYVQLVEAREKDEKFIFGWMLHRVS